MASGGTTNDIFVDEEDDISPSRNGASQDESFKTPQKIEKKRTKKLVLVRKRKKACLNSSRDKLLRNISWSTGKNASLNSSSIQRQSLRTNNRALAQSLARVKLDLRAANEMIVDLRKENQDLMINVASLKRVAGIKDDEVESEVQRRLERHMFELKEVLANLSNHLYASGVCLGDALEKCLAVGRTSTSGSRNPSLENRCTGSPENYSPRSKTGSGEGVNMDPINMRAEMSMIAEQSMLMEEDIDMAPLESHAEDLLAEVEEDEVAHESESMKDTKKALPRRVRRSWNKLEKEHEMDMDGDANALKTSVRNDRRGTFVLRSDDTPNEKKNVMSCAEGNHVSSRKSRSSSRHPSEDSDISPLSNSEEEVGDDINRRQTFFVKSDLNLQQLEQSEDICISDRRGTFVLPKPPVFQNGDENIEMEDNSSFEDKTTFFNTDMDFTEIIDVPKPAILAKDISKKKTVEKNHKELVTAKRYKETSSTSQSDSSENETSDKSKSVVELRLPKPGKILFAACRKEIDGTRKPVSSKLPVKARSKRKKDHSTAEKETPNGDIKSVFDFHDKTPTAPLEAVPKIQTSVYDISLNESSNPPGLTMVEHRALVAADACQLLGDGKTTDNASEGHSEDSASIYASLGMKEKAMETLSTGEALYCLPLKGSPEEDKPTKSSRARSKSRSRSKSTQKKDLSDDEDFKPTRRGRSKSRGRKNLDDDDDFQPKERGRSISRSKKKVENDDSVEETEPKDIIRRTRSRSRRRKLSTEKTDQNIADNQEEHTRVRKSSEKIPDKGAHSRRTKVTVNYAESSEEECQAKKVDSGNRKTSGISIDEQSISSSKQPMSGNRKVMIESSDDEDVSTRGRSRSRKRAQDKNIQPKNRLTITFDALQDDEVISPSKDNPSIDTKDKKDRTDKVVLPTQNESSRSESASGDYEDDTILVIPPSIHVGSRSKQQVSDDEKLKSILHRSRSQKRVESESNTLPTQVSSPNLVITNDGENERKVWKERGRSKSRKRKPIENTQADNLLELKKLTCQSDDVSNGLVSDDKNEDNIPSTKKMIISDTEGEISEDEIQVRRRKPASKARNPLWSVDSENVSGEEESNSKSVENEKSIPRKHDKEARTAKCETEKQKASCSEDDFEAKSHKNSYKTPSQSKGSEKKSAKKTGGKTKSKSSKKKPTKEQTTEENMGSQTESAKKNVVTTPAIATEEVSKNQSGRNMLEALKRKLSYYKVDDKVLQENRSERNSVDRLSSDEPQAKRSRRAAGVVSYKEPALGGKLRQGDTFFRKPVEKSPIRKSGSLSIFSKENIPDTE